MKRVAVLGGGIGGVETAIDLQKYGFDVELVSDRDYLFVYPLAIWIPTGEATKDEVSVPLEKLAHAHGFRLTVDEVTEIRAADRAFVLKKGGVRRDFDYLVVAMGGHKVPHKGKEHVFTICGDPEENQLLKARVDALVARGGGRIAVGFGGNPKDSSGVRGGPAFEFLFNLHHLLKKRGLRDRFELTFFAPMAKPGIRLGEKALEMMDTLLARLDIRQRVGKKITAFEADGVLFEDGSRLESDLTMFIAAGDGHAVILRSDLPRNDAGFVLISRACEVQGFPWMYAVGDVAALEGPEWRAKQGHLAEIMARVAARDILRKEKNTGVPGDYVPHVSILCVMDMGNGAALVHRNLRRAIMIPMPVFGHWLKKGWGHYYKLSKLCKIPRLPGM